MRRSCAMQSYFSWSRACALAVQVGIVHAYKSSSMKGCAQGLPDVPLSRGATRLVLLVPMVSFPWPWDKQKSPSAVTKVRPIFALPVWQRGPGTMLAKMQRCWLKIGFPVFPIRKFKILNAKRWEEPEIVFLLKPYIEKAIRSEPENSRFEPEILFLLKPCVEKLIRSEPKFSGSNRKSCFCLNLVSKK